MESPLGKAQRRQNHTNQGSCRNHNKPLDERSKSRCRDCLDYEARRRDQKREDINRSLAEKREKEKAAKRENVHRILTDICEHGVALITENVRLMRLNETLRANFPWGMEDDWESLEEYTEWAEIGGASWDELPPQSVFAPILVWPKEAQELGEEFGIDGEEFPAFPQALLGPPTEDPHLNLYCVYYIVLMGSPSMALVRGHQPKWARRTLQFAGRARRALQQENFLLLHDHQILRAAAAELRLKVLTEVEATIPKRELDEAEEWFEESFAKVGCWQQSSKVPIPSTQEIIELFQTI